MGCQKQHAKAKSQPKVQNTKETGTRHIIDYPNQYIVFKFEISIKMWMYLFFRDDQIRH